MKEQIDSIIKKHCLKMQEVDKTKNIPMTVKALDVIVCQQPLG
jgi:hypothetical protein